MKRKNGFTLIEVLTVIIVLAIIALIAVPIIMNIINKANKSVFKDSAYALIKAGDLLYSTSEMEGAELSRKTFDFSDDNVKLDVKGELPTGGIMKVYENGEIAMAVTKGKYCATKGIYDKEVTITEDAESCEIPKLGLGDIVYFDPTLGENGLLCTEAEYQEENSKTGNKEGCMKWYVYNSEGNEVKLILDHNTTDKFAPATDVSVDLIMQQLYNDTRTWKSEADLVTIEELLNLIPWYKNEEYSDKNNWHDEYLQIYMEAFYKIGKEHFGEYPDENQVKNIQTWDMIMIDLFEKHNNLLLPKFFHVIPSSVCNVSIDFNNYGNCSGVVYWTKSEYDNEKIWFVASIETYMVVPIFKTEKKVGIRPVITISQ